LKKAGRSPNQTKEEVMPRDFFAATTEVSPKPARARWTTVASVVVHGLAIGSLIVIPIVSGGDTIVSLAKGVVFAAAAPPPLPSPPPARQPPPPAVDRKENGAPAVNRDAAPASSPKDPVVGDAVRGTDVPPGLRMPGPGGAGDATAVLGRGSGPVEFGSAPPQRSGPVRVGGAVLAPRRTQYVEPIYPRIAQATRTGARIVLEATIDEQGRVQNLRVLTPAPLFEQAAIDAVSQWRYEPTRLNGQAVAVLLIVTINFAR
jgi:protein TonB